MAKELLADPLEKGAREISYDFIGKMKIEERLGKRAPLETMSALFLLFDPLLEGKLGEEKGSPSPPESDFAVSEERAKVSAKIPPGQIETPVVVPKVSTASAVIGGGCCVHLSIEYMPSQQSLQLVGKGSTGSLPSLVLVGVLDSEGIMLAWGKLGIDGYHIKEGIITTNPGARLVIMTVNAVARVRWCEVFSC